jgi:hypothetical protein
MVFLDVDKKVWIIKDLKVPVIENIPMKEMKWFKDKVKWVTEREEKNDINQSEALKVDEEWWEKVAQIGLGITVDEINKTGISEPDFRDLMVEVYNFLSQLTTIERAKLFVLYDPEILKKDPKLLGTTQNSKN